MNILTWTVGLYSIFQFVPVTSEVGGGHCGSNKWGPACVKSCPSNCRPFHDIVHCDFTTGECLEGCDVGYHDTFCRTQCNSNCINNTCNQVDGECSIGCKNGTSCIVTTPPIATNKSNTDITQTHSDFTSCLGVSLTIIVTVILNALSALFVYAIWRRRRRRHQIRRNKRTDEGRAEETVEMNRLDTEYSN